MFWFVLFFSNYMCLFTLKSLSMGLYLLLCSFSISMLLSMYVLSWYSLIFFIMYMGGLLVLFVYTSSLKFKPYFFAVNTNLFLKILFKMNIFLLLLTVLTQITWKIKSFSWMNSFDFDNFSLNLFKESEILFIMNMGFLLLLVLWVMTKMSFRSRGALRPLF